MKFVISQVFSAKTVYFNFESLKVTMISVFAPKKIIANYTHIHIEGILEEMDGKN